MTDDKIAPFSSDEIQVLTRASTDFVYFVNNVFSLSSRHFIKGEHIDNTARLLSQNKKTMRVSARNHFKSYAFYAHIMWKMMFELQQKNIESQYFSFSQDLAGYHISKIKLAISSNPYFRHIRDRKPTAESVIKYTWDDKTYYTIDPHGLIQFKRGLHCLSPNTKLVVRNSETNEIARIMISSLHDNIKNIYNEVLTENGFVKILRKIARENTDSLKVIRLVNGAMMKVTSDHPHVITRDNIILTVPTTDLRVGDKIPFKVQLYENSKRGTYELGRLVGLYAGDGAYLGENKGIHFVNNPKKDTSKFMIKFTEQHLGAKTFYKDFETYERVGIAGKHIAELVRKFVKGRTARTKHLSSEIFEMSKDFRLGFVHGYMEADGTQPGKEKNNPYSGGLISSTSPQLLEDTADVISSLGLLYSIQRRELPTFFKGGYNSGMSYEDWLQKIPSDAITDEMKEKTQATGLRIYAHTATKYRFKVNHTFMTFEKDNNGMYWLPIVHLYNSNRIPEYVYDIEVDSDSHLFSLANGIITHNCDYVYIDDPFQDPENQLNPTIIKKINEIFKSNILDMPNEPDGELHVCGTPQTDEDFYFDKDITRRFAVKILPAITDEGKALWPEWMDIPELEMKRIERTDRIFKREYLCTPVYSTEGFFTREYLMKKVVNFDLVSQKARLKYPKQGEIIAGFDIGKKAHPSHLTVLEHRPNNKLVMIHQKWMDGWSYSNGKDFYDFAPTQLEYLKMVVRNFGIDRLYYDNTRGEFESFDEQGLLPRQMIPIVFSQKIKQIMSAAFDKVVERSQIELINEDRLITQICAVTNSLEAIQSTKGHGDSYWSICLALLGVKELSNYSEEGTQTNRKKITAGVKSIFSEGATIPLGF